MNTLTELEQAVDRTLFLSKAAAPSGNVFGFADTLDPNEIIENCFITISVTPPRSSKAVAIVTPSRQSNKEHEVQQSVQQSCDEIFTVNPKRQYEDDLPGGSSTKKGKV